MLFYVCAFMSFLECKSLKNVFRRYPDPCENFPAFSGIYSPFPRAKSNFWKALESFSRAPSILFGFFVSQSISEIYLRFFGIL